VIKIKNIVCPLDFFPASLRAFDYALNMAANYDAVLHVLHVISPIVPTAYDFPLNVSEYTGALQLNSKKEILKLAAKAEKANVRFRWATPIGSVDNEIRKALTRTEADLVVVGTHGRRGFERWILGSEADRLLRSCPVPLLTIRAVRGTRTAPGAIRRILVTTDFSTGTSEALKYASSIAQENQSRLTLLHVVDQLAVESPSKLALPTVDAARRQLEKLVPADVKAWCEVKTQVEIGVPYSTILDAVKSDKSDLLVMNVHGKSLLDRALLGSTAERVVRGAVCPVLLIPPSAKSQKRVHSKRKRA
jgi:nucleotide-binding universal stress UspA family protein